MDKWSNPLISSKQFLKSSNGNPGGDGTISPQQISPQFVLASDP